MRGLRIALAVLFVAVSTSAFAESHFRVSGNGRIFYEPDAFDLSFGIVTENPDIQQCKESHLAAIEKVGSFLDENRDKITSLKQDATRLQTVSPKGKKDRVFRFVTLYVVRVNDTEALLPLQEGLISSGVTEILGLDMFSEKLPQLLERARKEAIKDATTKAELAASELGWILTGASNVSFQETDWHSQRKASVKYGSRGYAYDPSKVPDITTYVSSQVVITFTFERKKNE